MDQKGVKLVAEELLTPKILAARLGITPDRVRRRLRKGHPRPAELRQKRWAIPEDWAKEIEQQVRNKQLKIIAKVVSQKGTCAAEHKVGDEFTISDKTPAGLCSWAFYALFPFVAVFQFGGRFPWEKEPDKTTVICPDPENPVVFELRRVWE